MSSHPLAAPSSTSLLSPISDRLNTSWMYAPNFMEPLGSALTRRTRLRYRSRLDSQ